MSRYVPPEIEGEAELTLWLRGQEFREASESAEARRREHEINRHEAHMDTHAVSGAAPDTSPLRGSLPTVEVLKRLASYMQQMEGLPLDYCLRMALEVLGVQHREDADVYVRAAKDQMGGEA